MWYQRFVSFPTLLLTGMMPWAVYEWMNEWVNEKNIYIARLKAYKCTCMLNLPRLAEN